MVLSFREISTASEEFARSLVPDFGEDRYPYDHSFDAFGVGHLSYMRSSQAQLLELLPELQQLDNPNDRELYEAGLRLQEQLDEFTSIVTPGFVEFDACVQVFLRRHRGERILLGRHIGDLQLLTVQFMDRKIDAREAVTKAIRRLEAIADLKEDELLLTVQLVNTALDKLAAIELKIEVELLLEPLLEEHRDL
jgi:hypothetical protein